MCPQWVRLEDQEGKPYFYNPEDSSVQWELPQVTSLEREIAGGRREREGLERMIGDNVSLLRSRSLPLGVVVNPARIVILQPRLALQRRRWERAKGQEPRGLRLGIGTIYSSSVSPGVERAGRPWGDPLCRDIILPPSSWTVFSELQGNLQPRRR